MATTQFTRTQTAGTSAKKFTVSMWFKTGLNSGGHGLWGCGTGTSDAVSIVHQSGGNLSLETYDGSSNPKLRTTRLFRDPAAWYHLVFSIDTTDSDANERLKIWINGVEETVFTNDVTITQDADIPGWSGSGDTMKIGNRILDGDAFYTGSLAHVHVIDGTIYAASAFGETDSTSGIWVAKTSPSVTYGTNGGFYKFASGALTTDSSGESNTLTEVGSPTTTKDNPDNNWCTVNPIDNYYGNSTFSNGNNTIVTPSSTYSYNTGTMYLSTGLWYWEEKINSSSGYDMVGIADKPSIATDGWLGYYTNTYCYRSENGQTYTAGSGTAYGDTFTTGDIIGVYLDLTNNKLYFAKNGTIQNSGTGISITAAASTTNGYYTPGVGDYHNSGGGTYDLNFGNGYFGTALIASASADAGGEGQFKYNPSTGTFDGSSKDFRAICTNNIATYG